VNGQAMCWTTTLCTIRSSPARRTPSARPLPAQYKSNLLVYAVFRSIPDGWVVRRPLLIAQSDRRVRRLRGPGPTTVAVAECSPPE
jgi:hypothetical protein